MTLRQKNISYFLEGLVGKTVTESSLNNILSIVFEQDIRVTNTNKNKELFGETKGLVCHNLAFSSIQLETYGYFDIFYLNTKDDKMYMTEVEINFVEV